MNYSYLTEAAFTARLFELSVIGGVNVPYLRQKYYNDVAKYNGPQENEVTSLLFSDGDSSLTYKPSEIVNPSILTNLRKVGKHDILRRFTEKI